MKSNSKYEYKILMDLQQYYNNIGVNCEEKKECCWMCEQTPPPSVLFPSCLEWSNAEVCARVCTRTYSSSP